VSFSKSGFPKPIPNSVSVEPTISGTSADAAGAAVQNGYSGRMLPSTVGAQALNSQWRLKSIGRE